MKQPQIFGSLPGNPRYSETVRRVARMDLALRRISRIQHQVRSRLPQPSPPPTIPYAAPFRELTWYQQIDPPPHCSMLHGAMLPFIDPSRQCAAYGIWTLFQPCSAFRHVPQASTTAGIAPRLPPRRNTAHSPIGAITPEQRIVTARQIQRRQCKLRTHV